MLISFWTYFMENILGMPKLLETNSHIVISMSMELPKFAGEHTNGGKE